jgi:hypothetical protein
MQMQRQCVALRGILGFGAPEIFLGELLAGFFIDVKRDGQANGNRKGVYVKARYQKLKLMH